MITSKKKKEGPCVLGLSLALLRLANENIKNRLELSITPLWHSFIDQPTYQGWQIHQFEVYTSPNPIIYCSLPPRRRTQGWRTADLGF